MRDYDAKAISGNVISASRQHRLPWPHSSKLYDEAVTKEKKERKKKKGDEKKAEKEEVDGIKQRMETGQ